VAEDDPVGYGKPPPNKQFRPGQSGNPGGRPKRQPSLLADLDAELAESCPVKDGHRELTVSKQRAFAKTVVSAAIRGEAWAANALIALVRAPPANSDETASPVDQELLDRFIEREIKRRTGKPTTDEEPPK
jgi:hypothetical protein